MTVRLVEDHSNCKHRFLAGPERAESHVKYGHCQDCHREVAIQLDKDGERTGRTWLVEYAPPRLAAID
jgi:hypothetical protein